MIKIQQELWLPHDMALLEHVRKRTAETFMHFVMQYVRNQSTTQFKDDAILAAIIEAIDLDDDQKISVLRHILDTQYSNRFYRNPSLASQSRNAIILSAVAILHTRMQGKSFRKVVDLVDTKNKVALLQTVLQFSQPETIHVLQCLLDHLVGMGKKNLEAVITDLWKNHRSVADYSTQMECLITLSTIQDILEIMPHEALFEYHLLAHHEQDVLRLLDIPENQNWIVYFSNLVSKTSNALDNQMNKLVASAALCYATARPDIFLKLFERIKPESREILLQSFATKNNVDIYTLERHIVLSKQPDLLPLVRHYNPQYYHYDKVKGDFFPKVRSDLLDPKARPLIKRITRISASTNICRKFSSFLGIDLAEISRQQESLPLLISMNPVLNDLRTEFYSLCQHVEFFLQRVDTHPQYFDKILKSGVIKSKKRLEKSKDSGMAGRGITGPQGSSTDESYLSELFNYAYLGTQSGIYVAKGLEGAELPRMVINLSKLLMQSQDLKQKGCHVSEAFHDGILLKAEDWGQNRTEPREEYLSAQCKLQTDFDVKMKRTHPTLVFDPLNSESTYTAHDLKSGKKVRYKKKFTDELYYGKDIAKVIANWAMRHFDHWPEDFQLSFLTELLSHQSETDKLKAVSECVANLCDYEVSVPGNLTLKLDFVDSLTMNQVNINLAQLREDLANSDMTAVKKFFDHHPFMKEVPFIVYGAMRLAKGPHSKEIQSLLYTFAKAFQKPDIIRNDASLWQLTALQQLILENYESYTYVNQLNDQIEFVTKMVGDTNLLGTHGAQLAQLRVALGCEALQNTDAFDVQLSENYTVLMNGLPNNPQRNTGHSALHSVSEIRDSLLTHELTTLLTSAQNYLYFCQFGKPHPRTGAGATDSRIHTRKDRLDGFQISATADHKDRISLTLSDPMSENFTTVINALISTLNLDSDGLKIEGNTLMLNYTLSDLLSRMKKAKINYHGIFVLDECGNLMLAKRSMPGAKQDLGLSSPGGHHNDPYHFNCALGLEEEFGLTCANPQRVVELMPLIARVGKQNDVGIFIAPFGSYHSKDQSRAFHAEVDEYVKDSETIKALHELRGLECRTVMPLNIVVEYQAQQLRDVLEALNFTPLCEVSVNSDTQIITRNQVDYQVPTVQFGEIQIRGLLPQETEMLLKMISIPRVKLKVEENGISIDGINPIHLANILESNKLDFERTARNDLNSSR